MKIIRLVLVCRETKVGNDGLPSTVLAKDVLWLQGAVANPTRVQEMLVRDNDGEKKSDDEDKELPTTPAANLAK